MRNKSGKTGITELAHIDKADYQCSAISKSSSTIYTLDRDGLRYEFLIRPKQKTSSLFVLFSGDAIRKKYTPPVFQRWSWSKHFPGHCIYFSDPILHLNENIGLGWYSGTKEQDALGTIVMIVREVADYLGIAPENIVSYGSSGGGFAALRFTHLLGQGATICINPQITTFKYIPRHFRRYLRVCYPGMTAEDVIEAFSEKLSLISLGDRMRNQKIIYVQNLLDNHHVEEHFKPFCACIGDENPLDESSSLPYFKKILFEDPKGHAKGESAEEFKRAIELLGKLKDSDHN